jgi:cobalt/nickel transport system permease protein
VHHTFIDRYSELHSPIHRLDPRTKIISLLVCVLAIVLTATAQTMRLAGYAVLLSVIIVVSSVPCWYILKRSLAVVPFVLALSLSAVFFGSRSTYWLAGTLARAWLAAVAMVALSSTTRFPDLLRGLRSLGIPSLLVMLFSFMYRYIYIFLDEAMRMERARQARSFGVRRTGRLRVFGHMIASLLLRAYERGERVYASMLSRGFDGELRTARPLRYGVTDAIFLCLFGAGIIIVKVW